MPIRALGSAHLGSAQANNKKHAEAQTPPAGTYEATDRPGFSCRFSTKICATGPASAILPPVELSTRYVMVPGVILLLTAIRRKRSAKSPDSMTPSIRSRALVWLAYHSSVN